MERALSKDVIVEGAVSEVWQAWTTEEGAVSFFAPELLNSQQPPQPIAGLVWSGGILTGM